MTPQEIWQGQALEAPRVSAIYIRHLMSDLARGTRIRKGIALVLGVPGVLYIVWRCWNSFQHRPMMVAGLGLTLLALVAQFAYRWRRLVSPALFSEEVGALDSLRFYRRELERQRDARLGSWRRLSLVVPGLITLLTSYVIELKPVPWALVAGEAIIIVGGFSLAVALEAWRARQLQREIDALDSLVVKDPSQ